VVLRRISRTLAALATTERARIGTSRALRLYFVALGMRARAGWLDFRTRSFRLRPSGRPTVTNHAAAYGPRLAPVDR
jgi:hypothetical protein